MPIRILPKRKGRSFRNTRRENRLEELGRVDAEKAYTSKGKRNLREEKDRIRSELKSGGKVKGVKEDPMRDRMKQPLKRKKYVFDSSSARRKDLKQQAYRAKVEELGGKVKFAGEWKKSKKKPKGGPKNPSQTARRKFFKNKTHGGGPDSGNIGRLKDAISKLKDKGLGKRVPSKPDLSKLKERMPKYMKPLRKGGSAKGPNRPRPTGPHMWVRGDKRKKYASGGVVMAGKKVGCQIK